MTTYNKSGHFTPERLVTPLLLGPLTKVDLISLYGLGPVTLENFTTTPLIRSSHSRRPCLSADQVLSLSKDLLPLRWSGPVTLEGLVASLLIRSFHSRKPGYLVFDQILSLSKDLLPLCWSGPVTLEGFTSPHPQLTAPFHFTPNYAFYQSEGTLLTLSLEFLMTYQPYH